MCFFCDFEVSFSLVWNEKMFPSVWQTQNQTAAPNQGAQAQTQATNMNIYMTPEQQYALQQQNWQQWQLYQSQLAQWQAQYGEQV